jgi:hypothetical protein
MGAIGEVISFDRVDGIDETKVDLGGGDVKTAQHFAPAGVDSVPLPGDKAALEDSVGSGNVQTTGYHDTENEGKAAPGEHRIYVRNLSGAIVLELWGKHDGTLAMEVFEAAGRVEIKAPTVILDSANVRLGSAAGQRVVCEGDLVSVIVPLLTAGPTPVTAVNPAQQTLTGYIAAGQCISGRVSVKAGP